MQIEVDEVHHEMLHASAEALGVDPTVMAEALIEYAMVYPSLEEGMGPLSYIMYYKSLKDEVEK